MGRLYVAVDGDEVLYEGDLPSCCRRAAWEADGSGFGCPRCGAGWDRPEEVPVSHTE